MLDRSNPLDAGSNIPQMPTSFCAEWNGYLGGIWNIFEHVNLSTENVNVQSQLFDYFGQLQGVADFDLNAGTQFDALVHGFSGHAQNSYGKICSTHSGGSGDLDGRMVYYKPMYAGPDAGKFQFAFAMPLTQGYPGVQYVLYNTYQPSFSASDRHNMVANWVQVVNASSSPGSGVLRFYSFAGQVLGEYAIELDVGQRRDFAAHAWGSNRVGFARWIPETASQKFQLRNVRYAYDNPSMQNSFATAFQLEALKPSAERLVAAFDTTQNQMSVLELANVTDAAIVVDVELFFGSSSMVYQYELEAMETRHLILNELVPAESIGMARVQSDTGDSLLSVVMQYARFNNGKIANMYGLALRPALGSEIRGSFNLHLGQETDVVLLNDSAQAQTVQVSLIAENGEDFSNGYISVSLPANSTTVFPVGNIVPEDRYGVIKVSGMQINTLVGYALRRRELEYVMPTPLR